MNQSDRQDEEKQVATELHTEVLAERDSGINRKQ